MGPNYLTQPTQPIDGPGPCTSRTGQLSELKLLHELNSYRCPMVHVIAALRVLIHPPRRSTLWKQQSV